MNITVVVAVASGADVTVAIGTVFCPSGDWIVRSLASPGVMMTDPIVTGELK